jgi:MarR family transcriptional regulator for hemolysin
MNSEAESTPRPPALGAVRRVGQLAQSAADRIAREHGLTMQQWELLMRLRQAGGGADQRELCCAFGVAPATFSVLLDAVAERGLVEREQHLVDRRRRIVRLTPAGLAQLDATPHLGREVGRRMTAGLSAGERATLADLLDRCARNLESSR